MTADLPRRIQLSGLPGSYRFGARTVLVYPAEPVADPQLIEQRIAAAADAAALAALEGPSS